MTYTVVSSVSPAATGSLTNIASVSPAPGHSDPDATNNSATDVDTLNPTGDLSITKTDGTDTVQTGGPVTYTIVVTNTGSSDVVGATVSDTFSSALVGTTWTCTASEGASCSAEGSGAIADVVNIPVGGSLTYLASGVVAANAGDTLTNTASVTPPTGFTDSDGSDNTATDIDNVDRLADLSVTKNDGVTSGDRWRHHDLHHRRRQQRDRVRHAGPASPIRSPARWRRRAGRVWHRPAPPAALPLAPAPSTRSSMWRRTGP